MFAKLWNDESGIVGLEYLLLATIVGLGLVVGFSSVASALNVEFTELANAILTLDQSYSYEAASGCSGTHGGANITDTASSVTYAQSGTITPGFSSQNVSTSVTGAGCP